MAYKIGRFEQPWQRAADVKMAPSIIVGLGGTGQQVLLKIRRLFAERYGSSEAVPAVKYLYIDTDRAPASQEDLTRDNDPLLTAIDFKPAETLSLGVNVREYVRNIDKYPNVKRWFKTNGELSDLGYLEGPAGQVRSAGRLAIFEHFDQIRDALSEAESVFALANQEAMREMDFEVDYSCLNVYVITSLAGGTGSGMFLDLGYLIKHFYADRQPTVIGFGVLPKAYSRHGTRTLANGCKSSTTMRHSPPKTNRYSPSVLPV
jgi:hypothetical protein